MAIAETSTPQSKSPDHGSFHDRWVRELYLLAQSEQIELEITGPEEGELPLAWARRVEIPESLIAITSASLLGVSFVEKLSSLRPAATFVQKFPISYARQHTVMLFTNEEEQLSLALAHPDDWSSIDTVSRVLGKYPQPFFAPREEIIKAINIAYEQQSSQPDAVLDSLSQEEARSKILELERDDLLSTEGQAPVVELINLILLDAVKRWASDVHFQPYREKLIVRNRIDGVLFDAHTVPKAIQEEVLSRVKVMGKMNIAEKRLPQDGRATVTVGDRIIDLRIASLPGNYGERIVLRLLDKSAQIFSLSQLGMEDQTRERFSQLLHQEHGLILLTGPTGSGKSTTLYAGLQEINTDDRNVITLEDPIEYDIEGISQTQINVKKGLTFAQGLRNVLRQDPDIIMVGEIRDQETAEMAIQSALTGHLVFSTLHTNDASSAVTRLLDLGIEPYLVSSSLLAVLAQRLVRRVCPACATPTEITEEDCFLLQTNKEYFGAESYIKGSSCEACRDTGYKGRIAVNELLVVDQNIREKIQARTTAAEIRDAGIADVMRSLRTDGILKIHSGTTTPSEVARVTLKTNL